MLKKLSLPPHALKAFDKHFSYAMPAVIGLLIIGLAVPRLIAEVRLVPAEAVLEKLRLTPVDKVSTASTQKSLKQVEADLQAAAKIHDGNPDIFADLAFAQLSQLDVIDATSPEATELLTKAIGNLEESLRRNPANSFAWARLASALVFKDGRVTAEALDALRWSYRTGPFMEKLAYFRTDLGIRIYRELDFDLKQRLSEEIEFFFQINWAARLELLSLGCKHKAAFIIQNAIAGILDTKELDSYYTSFLSPTACKHIAESRKRKAEEAAKEEAKQ